MAKTQLKAGAYLDTVTQPEIDASLKKALANWRVEVARGDSYRHFSRNGTVDASGNLSIGGSDSSFEGLGPAESMVWAVTRVAVTNAVSAGTPVLRVFRNAPDPSQLVRGALTVASTDASHEFGGPGLVLAAGSVILLTGSSLTAGTVVTFTGDAREVPASMVWRLGGS